MKDFEKSKKVIDDVRNILIKYGNKEYGDCIIDEIMFVTGNETTVDVTLASFLDGFSPIVKNKFEEELIDDKTEFGGKSYPKETLKDFLIDAFLDRYISGAEEIPTNKKINKALVECGIEKIDFSVAIPYAHFLDWYFNSGSDQENEDNRLAMAEQVIEKMYNNRPYDIQSLFESTNLESFPLHLCVGFEDAQETDMLGDIGAYIV